MTLSRSSDIALALGAKNINISYAHDNYSYIGIDIPHENPFDVNLLDIVESKEYQVKQKPLSIVLGRDIEGTPVLLNLANSPKSVEGRAQPCFLFISLKTSTWQAEKVVGNFSSKRAP